MTRRSARRSSTIAAALLALVATGLFGGGAGACPLLPPELTQGFSLTGWFDGWTERSPPPGSLEQLRERGMGHVRLPITAEGVMTRFTPAQAIETRRGRIEAALDRLTAIGFAVIVDLHGGGRLERLFAEDPEAAERAVVQAWTVLGPLVEKRASLKVSAEILNEPPVDDAVWAAMQQRIVRAVRPVMPKATLVVSTGGPQRVERLLAATPIDDPDTIYAVHYYDPMVFTHQGADWIRPDPIGWLHDVPFPIRLEDPRLKALAAEMRAEGRERVAAYLDSLHDLSFGAVDIRGAMRAIGDWSRAHGRPVIIGEFGVYRDVAPAAYRRNWLGLVANAARENCVGWTHWEYRDGFGLADPITGRPDEATIAAMVERRPLGWRGPTR